MNRIPDERLRILAASVMRGSSIRSTAELIETNIPTVLRNITILAKAAWDLHDAQARNLKVDFLECDELVTFIHAKEDKLPIELKGLADFGEMHTWLGMCAESRFVITWRIGKHTLADAQVFADDLAFRIPGKLQIHTDQLASYNPAFRNSFGDRASYATVRKTMGEAQKSSDGQFVQPELEEARVRSEFGDPDLEEVTTNHVERLNATLRTWNSAYRRRTLAFAKKLQNLDQRLALNFFYYNFVHQHDSLDGITAAMAAGVTDRLWSIRDLVQLARPPMAA